MFMDVSVVARRLSLKHKQRIYIHTVANVVGVDGARDGTVRFAYDAHTHTHTHARMYT